MSPNSAHNESMRKVFVPVRACPKQMKRATGEDILPVGSPCRWLNALPACHGSTFLVEAKTVESDDQQVHGVCEFLRDNHFFICAEVPQTYFAFCFLWLTGLLMESIRTRTAENVIPFDLGDSVSKLTPALFFQSKKKKKKKRAILSTFGHSRHNIFGW